MEVGIIKYMGSKRRIAKEIIPIITKGRTTETVYDLFCGGFNLIDKIEGKRVANDNNKYLIALAKYMQENEDLHLPHIGEIEYKNIQKNKDSYPDWLVGYVGFQLSFGAKFFGGYRRDKAGIRDYENEAQQNLKAQQPKIKDIKLHCGSYDEVILEPNSIIYCDIPYKDSTKYTTSKDFDYDKFYSWCIEKHREGHKVFVSEYWMPEDKFECIWSKEIVSSLTSENNGKKGVEKLFIVR